MLHILPCWGIPLLTVIVWTGLLNNASLQIEIREIHIYNNYMSYPYSRHGYIDSLIPLLAACQCIILSHSRQHYHAWVAIHDSTSAALVAACVCQYSRWVASI